MGNNDDIFITIISVTAVLLILLIFIVSFLLMYKNRQQKHRREMELAEEKYKREILQTQLEIKEQTMKNIAEEIHDNVGQLLSLVVVSLSGIEVSDPAKAAEKIEHSIGIVEKAVGDLRNLSKSLDPENVADLGLPVLVKFELDMLEKTGAYKTSFNMSGNEKRLNKGSELVVYRIIQESLNNIMKHAKANSISISLDFSSDRLALNIIDNGKGFSVEEVGGRTITKSGAGLRNMKNRTNLIGGSFEISSVPLQGTTISMSIPFNNDK